jgi:hypothetical protein
VEAVIARQDAILGEHHPAVHLVVGQAALHQQFGGTAIMDEQLRRLAQVAADGGPVTVQVLPFEAGAHAATAEGALGILQFAGTAGLGLVHLGGIGRASAWRIGATSSPTPRHSIACALSPAPPRNPHCFCAASPACSGTAGFTAKGSGPGRRQEIREYLTVISHGDIGWPDFAA